MHTSPGPIFDRLLEYGFAPSALSLHLNQKILHFLFSAQLMTDFQNDDFAIHRTVFAKRYGQMFHKINLTYNLFHFQLLYLTF